MLSELQPIAIKKIYIEIQRGKGIRTTPYPGVNAKSNNKNFIPVDN